MSDDRAALWAALLACRERGIRVALARGAHRDDVDDIVQEALARVAGMRNVELSNVGALLTVVVANLVTDAYRYQSRTARAAPRLASPPSTPAPDEDILDAAEARWLWSRRLELADQDRRVLELRTQGLTVGDTASELGVTYKAAENAFTRARARMRTVWLATAGVVGAFSAAAWRRLRPTGAAAAAAGIATLVVALMPTVGLPTGAPNARQSLLVTDSHQKPSGRTLQRVPAQPGRAGRRPSIVASSRNNGIETAKTPPVGVGRLRYSGVTVRKRHEDETFAETIERCLRAGVEISPTRVRCREYQGAGTQYSPPGQIVVGP